MIHRAVLGSLERFIGVYLEHRRGRLPLWLCPVQTIVLPIGESDRSLFHKKFKKSLNSEGIICKIDTRNEKLSYKIRQAQLLQIPYMIVIGKKEAQTGLLSLRLREGKAYRAFLEILLKRALLKEIKERALCSVFSEYFKGSQSLDLSKKDFRIAEKGREAPCQLPHTGSLKCA